MMDYIEKRMGKIITGIIGGLVGAGVGYVIFVVIALASLFNRTPEHIVILQMLGMILVAGAIGYGIHLGLNWIFNIE